MAIARALAGRRDPRPLPEVYGRSGAALGERVYRVRCGVCHWAGGPADIGDALVGLTRSNAETILDDAADLAEEMPPFTGNAVEREALVEFLLAFKEKEKEKEEEAGASR